MANNTNKTKDLVNTNHPANNNTTSASAEDKAFEARTPDVIHTIGFRHTGDLQHKETLTNTKRAIDQREKSEKYVFDELANGIATQQLYRIEVDGVERSEGTIWVIGHYKGAAIRIPETAFFEPHYQFPKRLNYDEQTPQEQANIRFSALQNYMGSIVPVLIISVASEGITRPDKIGADSRRYAIGSRCAAMSLLRDIYYYHKNTKDNARQITLTKGAKAFAQILCVAPRMLTVEVCGVETRMDLFSVSNEPIETTYGKFKTGQQLEVRITKIHDNGDDDLYLGVTARVDLVSKDINSMSIGSSYRGKVDSYDRFNHRYNIRLKNGVNALVTESAVYRHMRLVDNDVVDVVVTKICPTFVIGTAKKA